MDARQLMWIKRLGRQESKMITFGWFGNASKSTDSDNCEVVFEIAHDARARRAW